jgi:hypothetical protein
MCKVWTKDIGNRVIVLLALLTAGCAESPPADFAPATDVIPTARRVAATPADHRLAVDPATDTATNSPQSSAADATTDSAADSTAGEAPADKFDLPYPDRSQLFQSPKVRRSAVAKRGTQENSQRVRLKGFVNLDGIRAILVVNGETTSLAAGDKSQGIEVISIKPPRVTLQRGRVRWTESIQ